MKEVYLLSRVIDGEKYYLRYGMNGGGGHGFCLYRGEIVCFSTRDGAELTRATLDCWTEWDVERFVR